ncbi:hypothetical protein [Planococcus maritimus]|nr:hypothetical protein [Planococcus maritimus]
MEKCAAVMGVKMEEALYFTRVITFDLTPTGEVCPFVVNLKSRAADI